MKANEFKNYMEHARKADRDELENLACAAYLLLDMTDKQIKTLADMLVNEKGYEAIDGRLTIAQPEPHKVVVFGACELTL